MRTEDRKPRRTTPARKQTSPLPRGPHTEDVDPRWLAKAIALVLGIALVCGYLTLCWLFSHGQWQLVLHPSRDHAAFSSFDGDPAQAIEFDVDATGTPQLSGYWIPARRGGRYPLTTILYLRGGDQSLAADGQALRNLHAVGANILAFDYRGYGASAGAHPTQITMRSDAAAALQYLMTERHLAPKGVVLYGRGVGAALAVQVAHDHGDIPALVLDGARGDLLPVAQRAPSGRFLPVALLFHNRFALKETLDHLATPKLIITRAEEERGRAMLAHDPKITVALPPGAPASDYTRVMNRFLDTYLPPSPLPRLVPDTAGRIR